MGVLQNLALKLFVNHCSRPWITLLVCVSCVIAQALKHKKKGGQTKQYTGNVWVLDASLFWELPHRVTLIFPWLFLCRVVARTLDPGRHPLPPSHSHAPVTSPRALMCLLQPSLTLQEIYQITFQLIICKNQTLYVRYITLNGLNNIYKKGGK